MANSDKNIRITTSKNKTTYPNIVFTGSAAGSSVITLEVLDDNTLSFTSNEGQVFSIDSNLSTGTIWAVSDISGVPLLSSSAGGTVGIAVYGGIVGIGQTNPTYKLDLKGSFGLASSNDSLYNFIFSNSAASGSNSFQVRSANSILLYNSGNTFYTGLKSNAAANVTYTLPTTDGSSGQFLQTNGTGTLSWATATGGAGSGSSGVNPGGQYQIGYYASTGASIDGSSTFTNNTSTGVVSISHSTVSTNFSNGALTVTGGVGIGGSLNVGGIGASISGVTISNSTINRGTWNGTAIATQYGGTGQNFSSSTGLVQISSGTASVITTSSALASIISDETGSGSLVFGTTPTFTTSVVTGDATFAVFNTNATTINAFGAATVLSIGSNTGTATFNSANNTTAANTGAVVFSGGVGIGKSVSIGGRLLLFNGSTYTGFASSQIGAGSTTYFLPTSTPATGTSVLQSDSAGFMSWVPMVASSSGAGSGTVAIPGAQYQIAAYYAGSGASVSGSSTFTNNIANNVVNISHPTAAISTATGALTVSGGVGIGGSLFTGTAFSSSISGVILSNNTVNASTYNKVTITAPASSATLTLADGSSLITSGANSLTLTTTALTNVTLPTTGTLVNTAVTSLASLTTASSLNSVGTITSGTWSATAITAFYGGTGYNSYTTGDILVGAGNTFIKLNSGATNFVLTSNGTGAVPSWQSVPPSAASSVAVTPTVLNQSFFITTVSASSGSGLGLSTITSFVVNPSTGLVSLSGLAVTNTTATTSNTTGALTVAGGAGIANSAFIGGMLRVGSNSFTKSYSLGDIALDNGSAVDTPAVTHYFGNNLNLGTDVYSDGVGSTRYRIVYNLNETGGREVFTVDTNANLRLYNSGGGNYFGLRFAGSATTTYTLPASTPAGTAVSVLQSDQAGNMSWVAMTTGGGSGSVNSGSSTFAAYYASTTNAVSENANLQFTGTGLSVGGNLQSTSTLSGSLQVRGGLGITGNAFIGGTSVISNSTVSISTTSGALVVTGGVGIGGSLFTATGSSSSVSGVILANNTVNASTYNKVTITAPASSATLTLADGSSLITSGGNSLTLTTTNTTSVTLPTSGTLVNTAVTSLGSLTTASALNSVGTITSGTWAATAITGFYGGTGYNSYTTGDILVGAGNTFIRLNSGSTNFVLTSNGTGSVPSWQAVPSSSASSVAVAPTALAQSFFITTVSTSSGSGLGLSTITSFVVNPNTGLVTVSGLAVTNLSNSTSITTGALTVAGGLGVTGNAFIGGTASVTSNQATTSTNTGALVVTGGLGVGGNAFIGGTVYVPSTTPSNYSNLLVSNNSASTSTSSGALVVTGGLGVGGNAFIGGTLNVPSSTPSNFSNLLISNNTATTSTTSGALVVTGGLGLGGNAFIGGTINVPSSTPSNFSNLLVSNNTATTSTTSGALVVTGGLGVGGNAFIGGTLNVSSSTPSNFSNLLVSNNTATTSTTSGALVVTGGLGVGGNAFIGGTVYVPSSTPSNYSNLLVSNNTSSTSTSSGALVVNGGLGLAGNAFIGGTTTIQSSQVSISTNSGALVVTGGVGIGGSLYTSAGSTSSVSGVLLQNGNVSASTYNKLTLTAPANSATLTLANNSTLATSGANSLTLTTTNTTSVTLPTAGTLTSTGNNLGVFASTTSAQLIGVISDATGTAGKLVFSTSPTFTTSVLTDSASFNVFNATATTINAFQAGTAISLGAATGTLTLNNAITLHNQTTPSTSTTTGAIVVSGGVGIGLSISVGGSLNIFNGANYSGFRFAGSASTTYTLPPRTPTGTGSSYLSSGIDGTMAWVAAPSGGGATPGGTTDGDIQYKVGSSFAAISDFNFDQSYTQLTVKNFPGTTPITAIHAAVKILGQSASWTGSSSNGTMLGINGSSTWAGNLIEAQKNGAQRLILDSSGYLTLGAAGTGFTLPITNGSAGQVLTANTNGIATWTTVTGSSSSGGTVYAGTANQIAFYGATGNTVGGSATFTNTLSTGVVNITHTTPSSSTSTGALVVAGSAGLGGSLYVGGQINQTYQPVQGAAIDHAIFLQSNPVPTAVGALIQIGSANKWDGVTAGFFNGSSNGTYLGINSASGNTADYVNFQENGVTVFSVGAGGTNIRLGQALGYTGTNVLASFVSTVNSYNQVIIQNKSNGNAASADFVLNNDVSTDTTFYGNLGINSSTFNGTGSLSLPNATYLTATTGDLVLGTTTQNPIRFVVNGGTTDMLYFDGAGLAISCFANFGLRSASDLRFWNSGNTFYGAFQGGAYTASYILTMPTATVGAGVSALITGSDGQMYFAQPGSGIAFSTVTGNTPTIRAKRPLNIYMATGYTPTVAGTDTAIFRIPESSDDGTTVVTYQLRRFTYRVETPSAGQSRIQIERSSSDTGAFALAATGSSHLGGLGLTISGAGIYITSTTSFAGTLVTSGNLLRLNWTLLNATHANFSAQLILQEV